MNHSDVSARKFSLAHVVDQHVPHRADHPAIEASNRCVPYGELSEVVKQLARSLRSRRVKTGDLVAVRMANTIEHLAVLCSLAKCGAAVVPIPDHIPDYCQRQLLEGVNIRMIIVDRLDRPMGKAPAIDVRDLLANQDANSMCETSSHTVDGTCPFMLSQSSGTTGQPKRFLLTHAHMCHRIRENARFQDLTTAERCLQAPLLSFVLGINRAFMILDLGATIILHTPRSAADFANTVVQQKVTATFMTPQQLSQATSVSLRTPQLPDLKVITATANLYPDQIQRCRSVLTPQLFQYYGTNEIGAITAAGPDDTKNVPQSVGRAVEGVALQIVDDHEQLLPANTIGFVRLRKTMPDPTSTYLDNPDDTARTFRQGWYYPGDLGMIDGNGYVFLKGRVDDVINANGTKFYPIDVETVLLLHPAVAEAAVVSIPVPSQGDVVVAFVVPRQAISAHVLIDHCRQRLGFKAPRKIFLLRELPRNPAGKVLKQSLKSNIKLTS